MSICCLFFWRRCCCCWCRRRCCRSYDFFSSSKALLLLLLLLLQLCLSHNFANDPFKLLLASRLIGAPQMPRISWMHIKFINFIFYSFWFAFEFNILCVFLWCDYFNFLLSSYHLWMIFFWRKKKISLSFVYFYFIRLNYIR